MMWKPYQVLILAVVSAIAVPLGFALSLEPTLTHTVAVGSKSSEVSDIGNIAIVAASSARTHLALVQTSAPARSGLPMLPDGAKLFFLGSALLGLAAVIRRIN
jgi:hypothetical protein